ncbi:Hypothetical predicted protein [Mytilus galloprovincialis]|uniref:Uncharacterized protein n=1 Tax=Mytilus galloprovincialis TaxID=29158 RepID=A0A8B6GP09_MYTGA|nr:Hypothetical predicted protein [Mytilus galloprovincialis]
MSESDDSSASRSRTFTEKGQQQFEDEYSKRNKHICKAYDQIANHLNRIPQCLTIEDLESVQKELATCGEKHSKLCLDLVDFCQRRGTLASKELAQTHRMTHQGFCRTRNRNEEKKQASLDEQKARADREKANLAAELDLLEAKREAAAAEAEVDALSESPESSETSVKYELNIQSEPLDAKARTKTYVQQLNSAKQDVQTRVTNNNQHIESSYRVPETNLDPRVEPFIPSQSVAEVAESFYHLQDIAHHIPQIDNEAHIMMLIGRDVISAHHVLDQRIGLANLPYAQKLRLGWCIIGESCLGSVHVPKELRVNKTSILENGRPTLFDPCNNQIKLKEIVHDVFEKKDDDDKPGLSIEDRSFLNMMDSSFRKDENGNMELSVAL